MKQLFQRLLAMLYRLPSCHTVTLERYATGAHYAPMPVAQRFRALGYEVCEQLVMAGYYDLAEIGALQQRIARVQLFWWPTRDNAQRLPACLEDGYTQPLARYLPMPHAVIYAGVSAYPDDALLRHEAMHAATGRLDHPAELFSTGDRC